MIDTKAIQAGLKDRRCQVDGCGAYTRYGIYKLSLDKSKKWVEVCDEHEKLIGAENIRIQGGKKWQT